MEGNYNNLFNYKIAYSKKRKKTIGFKIKDGVLLITSPQRVSKSFLIELIEKRKYWAIERIEKNKKKNLINDDKILFLGKEINVNVEQNGLLKNGGYCELKDNNLFVNISKDYTDTLLENVIKNWYKEKCLQFVKDRVLFFANKHNLSYGKITIKEQKTVWGTCNFKNDLTFNLKLMAFRPEVIDYLVVHELSHTIHKNHSKEYWKMVESILPNYKELNNELKNR